MHFKLHPGKFILKIAAICIFGLSLHAANCQSLKLKVCETDATSIKLHWEPLDNIKEYTVYRNNNNMGSTISKTVHFTDFRLKPNQTYSYYVDAVDINDNKFRSDTISVTTNSSSYIRTRYKVLALAFYPGKTDNNELSGIKTYFRHRLEFIKLASLGSAIIEPYKNDIIVLHVYPPSTPQANFNINYSLLVKTPYLELDGYSIIDLIEKGDIDFVWIAKSPEGYNFGENALIGNKNVGNEIWGWVSEKVGCSRSFFVNAYLPDERCNDAYAHMVEGIMTSICNSFPETWPRNTPYSIYSQIRTDFVTRKTRYLHLFEKYRLTDQWGGPGGEQYSSDDNGNCGTSHFPPNSRRSIGGNYQGDYAYFDNQTWQRYIDCYADDWFNFPAFKNDKRKMNGYDYGAFNNYIINDPSYSSTLANSPENHQSFSWGAASYHQWWFAHLPHNPGVSNNLLNNWWPYIYDFNRFYGSAITYTVDSFPSVSPRFYPAITTNEIEDTVTDHWGYWHSHNGFGPFGKNGIITLTEKTVEPGNVKCGSSSIKITVQNAELYEGADKGSNEIFYPRTKNARWYFSYLDTFYLSIKQGKNPDRIIGTNPVIKLCTNEGNRIELVPLKDGKYSNLFGYQTLKDDSGWYNFSIPVTGNNSWEKNIIGYIDPSLSSVEKAAARLTLEQEILANVNYFKICIKSTRLSTPVDICSFSIDNIRFHYSCNDCLLPSPAGKISGDTSIYIPEETSFAFPEYYYVPEIKGATSYIWVLPSGDSIITSENAVTIRFDINTLPGTLKVKGYNQFGYGAESYLRIGTTSVPDAIHELIENDIEVYPNPTTGLVEIRMNEPETLYKIDVYNLYSRILSFDKNNIGHLVQVDLSDLPAGIYFIRASNKYKAYTFKIIRR